MEDFTFGRRLFDVDRRQAERALLATEEGPRCRLTHEARAVRLRLSGPFPTGWASSLTTGIAAHGVGILRGFAQRLAEGRWVADFELTPAAPAVLEALDFLALATARPDDSAPTPISLDRFYIDGSPDSGGSLFLEVRGPDRVGFLSGLLERVAFVSLFPEEMTIETRARIVHDTFLLRGPAGQTPDASAERALTEVLGDLLSR